jgi:hypothetical protein
VIPAESSFRNFLRAFGTSRKYASVQRKREDLVSPVISPDLIALVKHVAKILWERASWSSVFRARMISFERILGIASHSF